MSNNTNYKILKSIWSVFVFEEFRCWLHSLFYQEWVAISYNITYLKFHLIYMYLKVCFFEPWLFTDSFDNSLTWNVILAKTLNNLWFKDIYTLK